MRLRRFIVGVLVLCTSITIFFVAISHAVNVQLVSSHQITIYGAVWNKDESRILTSKGAVVEVWVVATGNNLLTLSLSQSTFGAISSASLHKDEIRILNDFGS